MHMSIGKGVKKALLLVSAVFFLAFFNNTNDCFIQNHHLVSTNEMNAPIHIPTAAMMLLYCWFSSCWVVKMKPQKGTRKSAARQKAREVRERNAKGGENAVSLWFACQRVLPASSRPDIWRKLLGYDDMEGPPKAELHLRERRYKELLYQRCRLDGDEKVSLTNPPTTIDHDVARTQVKLAFFAGGKDYSIPGSQSSFSISQECLRRILCTTCGCDCNAKERKCIPYVQGMNEVAGHFLYAFCAGDVRNICDRIEVDTFWCFNFLLLYAHPSTCPAMLSGFKRLLRHFCKKLFHHLEALDTVILESVATRWFVALFVQDFAIDATLGIWDFIFSYRRYFVDALTYVAVAVCKIREADLLASHSIEKAMTVLKKIDSIPVENLLETARGLLQQLNCHGFRSKQLSASSPRLFNIGCQLLFFVRDYLQNERLFPRLFQGPTPWNLNYFSFSTPTKRKADAVLGDPLAFEKPLH
eukprot:gene6014-4318_t